MIQPGISATLVVFIHDICNLPPGRILDETLLGEDLGMSDEDLEELQSLIRDEFDCLVVLRKEDTFRRLVDVVRAGIRRLKSAYYTNYA